MEIFLIFGDYLPFGILQVLSFPIEGPLHEQLKYPAVFVHEASDLWQL